MKRRNRPQVKDWRAYLRAFRKNHGLKQKELAALLPAGLRTVEDWEAAGENPKRTPPDILYRALKDLARELRAPTRQ